MQQCENPHQQKSNKGKEEEERLPQRREYCKKPEWIEGKKTEPQACFRALIWTWVCLGKGKKSNERNERPWKTHRGLLLRLHLSEWEPTIVAPLGCREMGFILPFFLFSHVVSVIQTQNLRPQISLHTHRSFFPTFLFYFLIFKKGEAKCFLICQGFWNLWHVIVHGCIFDKL